MLIQIDTTNHFPLFFPTDLSDIDILLLFSPLFFSNFGLDVGPVYRQNLLATSLCQEAGRGAAAAGGGGGVASEDASPSGLHLPRSVEADSAFSAR